jgi:hypothetical protein
MKRHNRSEAPGEETFPPIDADVLARINDKIANAHKENDRPADPHRPRKVGGTATTKYSIADR